MLFRSRTAVSCRRTWQRQLTVIIKYMPGVPGMETFALQTLGPRYSALRGARGPTGVVENCLPIAECSVDVASFAGDGCHSASQGSLKRPQGLTSYGWFLPVRVMAQPQRSPQFCRIILRRYSWAVRLESGFARFATTLRTCRTAGNRRPRNPAHAPDDHR